MPKSGLVSTVALYKGTWMELLMTTLGICGLEWVVIKVGI